MPRRPHRPSPDEIKISRDADAAIIAYADPKVATTRFVIGREKLAEMTDEEIFALWHEHLEARDQTMQEYEHAAVEVPPGHPQVRYFAEGDQWVPRGDVLRCVVMGSQGEPDEPFLTIDDCDFAPREFARMVSAFGGWGMRIVFVPDDELHDEPNITVREPGRGR